MVRALWLPVQASSQSSIERTLRSSRLLGSVGDELVRELGRSAVRRHHTRGDFIWKAGDPAANLIIIASGLVKVCQPGREGTRAIVAIFGPRESIGDIAVISRGSYPADAVAASDTVELLCIGKASVLAAMDRDLSMAQAVNRSLVEHSQALREKIRIMTAGAVDRRLAELLGHLSRRFGDEVEGGVMIPVVLSRAELACLVGTTVETTIRIISRWQKEGILSTIPEGFVIHRPEALNIATGENA